MEWIGHGLARNVRHERKLLYADVQCVVSAGHLYVFPATRKNRWGGDLPGISRVLQFWVGHGFVYVV